MIAHPDKPEERKPDKHSHAAWDARLRKPLELGGSGQGIPEAWFLGSRAENADLLRALVMEAIDSHVAFRHSFHPQDPVHITEAVRNSPGYRDGVERLRRETAVLLEKLQLSAPLASMRYQGHMLWDQALPATVGMFAGMLYNQNNVAAEASPVTTRLEIEVGIDLCRMLGYGSQPNLPPWGHITSGGSVANIEALWAARNLKFSAVALRAAIREVPALHVAKTLEVKLWGGDSGRLVELDSWTLLNLDLDVIAGLPAALAEFGISPELLTRALAAYSLQNVGLIAFYRNFMADVAEPPVFLVAATGHYSWPKAATLLGLGQNACILQRVDRNARLELEHVEATLMDMRRRRVPLLCVVALMGSTEQSAVDPLAGLLDLRDEFRSRGLNFAIHADAAWGGYFRTMLRDESEPDVSMQIPTIAMSEYVRAQYAEFPRADSITVDPHKGGYVPYPAGALCYRNAAWRDSISLRAPVIFHNQSEPTVGVYGIEGSKPGSAAAAVWLAHRVIRPDRSGYGEILGQCMWTSKRLFCRLATLADPRISVTMFNMTPAEHRYGRAEEVAAERALLLEFVDYDNEGLRSRLERDPAARELFMQIGSDQVILAFSLNFRDVEGVLNRDLARANAFNQRVFALCSLTVPRADMNDLNLVLTSSRFDPRTYGHSFVDQYCHRMGVDPQPDTGVDFLISTTMDPWTTETDAGDFLAVIQEALRSAAHQALDDLGY